MMLFAFLREGGFYCWFASSVVVGVFSGFGSVSQGSFFQCAIGKVLVGLGQWFIIAAAIVAGFVYCWLAGVIIALCGLCSFKIGKQLFFKIHRPSGVKVAPPHKLDNPYLQSWISSIVPLPKNPEEMAEELIARIHDQRYQDAAQKEKQALSTFLDACWANTEVRALLDAANRNRDWLDLALSYFERFGHKIAGGITLCYPRLLKSFLDDCQEEGEVSMEAVFAAIARTGFVDDYYRR